MVYIIKHAAEREKQMIQSKDSCNARPRGSVTIVLIIHEREKKLLHVRKIDVTMYFLAFPRSCVHIRR